MAHHPHIPEGTAPLNFGPASKRDSIVFGSSRPAFSSDNEKPGAVEDKDVSEWTKFMQEQGVKRVVCLLTDDELKFYKTPLEEQMKAAGFDESKWTRAPLKSEGSADKIVGAFQAAEQSGEKIVVHCSAGAGRTALAEGLWLTSKYKLTPEEAAKEIADTASGDHVVRTPDASKLSELIENRKLK